MNDDKPTLLHKQKLDEYETSYDNCDVVHEYHYYMKDYAFYRVPYGRRIVPGFHQGFNPNYLDYCHSGTEISPTYLKTIVPTNKVMDLKRNLQKDANLHKNYLRRIQLLIRLLK